MSAFTFNYIWCKLYWCIQNIEKEKSCPPNYYNNIRIAIVARKKQYN